MSDNQFQLIMNKLNEMQDETNKRFCNMEESTNERFGNMNERFSKMDKRFDNLEKEFKETKDELQKEIQETNYNLEKELKEAKNEIKHVNIAAQGMIKILQDEIGEVKHRLGKIEEKQNLHEHQMTAMMNNMTKGFKENKEQISELQKEYNQLQNI